MACNKNKNKQWQDITYVTTLATALSKSAKSDVAIYKTYERGLGDVYCFDIFKKGKEPATTVKIVRFQQPKDVNVLSNNENAGLQSAAIGKTRKTATKSKRS
jgi:hypothetical protein